MTEIIDAVPEQIDARRWAAQLVEQARAEGIDLVGPDGLLTGLTKTVLETALEAEMSQHLGYDKHDPAGRDGGNSRNGTRAKTVLTEIGPVQIEVPRDRDGSFDPVIVKKRQRRLNGIDQLVLSLTARGLTTGEIAAHFDEVYGATVSKDTISRITDKVLEEMTEWCNRPLDRVYPVLFIDAIVVKVRDGQVVNRPVYVVVGVTVNGERDILGLWAGDGGEGAKFWLSVLTEVKNRGVEDVCIAVCDGLKGLPDAIGTVWPLTTVQASSVHNGAAEMISVVTRAVPGRTCADASPLRSRCRPVRPGRWRASHLPAGAAPPSAEMRFRRGRPLRGGLDLRGSHCCHPSTTPSSQLRCSPAWTGAAHSTSSA